MLTEYCYDILANGLEVQDHPKFLEVNEYDQAVLMCSFKSSRNIKITWEKGNDMVVNSSRVEIITIQAPSVSTRPPIVSNIFYLLSLYEPMLIVYLDIIIIVSFLSTQCYHLIWKSIDVDVLPVAWLP